ncbi:MAG: sugar phosphate isomerase/epimerase, partial [Verrucomicrobiota bacterium]
MNRRHFFRTSAFAGLSLPAFALDADNAYRQNIGIQLYTLRNQLKEDTPGTIKAIAEAGYQQIEAYGFPTASGEMIQAARDHGLAIHSSHFEWESVTDPEKEGVKPFSEILETAHEIGLSHLVVPYLHDRQRKTLDDWKLVAERCNQAAVQAKEADIQLAYHNHAFEYEPKEGGKTGFDVFVEEFAPEMKFEIDVFWVAVGGQDPVETLRSLSGRVSQVHLKDLKTGSEVP